MGAAINTRIQLKRDTTANWNAARGFIPLEGEVIIYTDYRVITKEVDGETRTVNVPAIKIGDGRAYVQDLPFMEEGIGEGFLDHIENKDIHVTPAQKQKWTNKINVNDYSEVVDGALVFNRN